MPLIERLDAGDGVTLAVQQWGSGATELVLVPGFISHLELQWADPAYARYLSNLGRFARVTAYDKRGGGCSTAVHKAPTLEEHVRDLARVIDHASVASDGPVVLLGFSNGGAIAISYAASHPERLAGLVLCSSFARVEGHYEIVAEFDGRYDSVIEQWGKGFGIDLAAPTLASSTLARRNYAVFEQAALHPAMLEAMVEETRKWDLTAMLGLVEAPTLVMHRTNDLTVPIEASRELARRIRHARFVELEGGDHVPFLGDTTSVLRAIESFVREIAEDPAPTPPQLTVLFTDLVGSTDALVTAGDARWRDLREAHDDLTRAEVGRNHGRSVKSTGDGWLAVFEESPDAIRAASAVREQVRRLGLEIRAGAHAGPVDVLDDGDVSGLTVNVAARVTAMAEAGEVLVTDAVRGRLATSAQVDPRGEARLKGIPGSWPLHNVAEEVEEFSPSRPDPDHAPAPRGWAKAAAVLGRHVIGPARTRLARAR